MMLSLWFLSLAQTERWDVCPEASLRSPMLDGCSHGLGIAPDATFASPNCILLVLSQSFSSDYDLPEDRQRVRHTAAWPAQGECMA